MGRSGHFKTIVTRWLILFRSFVFSLIFGLVYLAATQQQTATVIPANEAAAHTGEYATVEGVVAKVFTSKSGNTFLNIGASYPNQTFTGWIPPVSPFSKSPLLSSIEGKHVKITGRVEESPKSGSMPPLSSRLNETPSPNPGRRISPLK